MNNHTDSSIDQYWVRSKAKQYPSDENKPSLKDVIWQVIREDRQREGKIDHFLREGDVIKLGRVLMKVKSMSTNIEIDGFKTDAENEGIIDIPK